MRGTRLTLAATLVASAAVVGVPAAASAAPSTDTPVQLLAFNDFHGRIAGDGGNTPGAALFATARNQARDAFVAAGGSAANSLLVSNGDLIGATPFVSAVFRDEPTIEIANALGVVAGSVGNHEFDRGQQELYRVSAATDGSFSDDVTACEGVDIGVDGCFTDSTGQPFAGLDSPYLAANVIDDATGDPVLPPYTVVETSTGGRIAMIGVVTLQTPSLVIPSGIEGLTFTDPAEALSEWAGVVTAAGFDGGPVDAVVGLVHEGAAQADPADPSACEDVTGSLVAIDEAASDQVDLLIGGHTHEPFVCQPGDTNSEGHVFRRPVTEASPYSEMITDIRFQLLAAGGISAVTATNIDIDAAGTPDSSDPQVAEVQAIVAYWQARSAEAGAQSVGTQTADLDRAYRAGTAVRDSESGLGNLIADAQLAAMSAPALGGAQIAFMNPGGIRADINCLSSGPGDPDGNITLAEAFTAQPFGNTVNTVQLTPADIDAVLEQQWRTAADGSETFLQLSVSEGFSYEYDPRAPIGQRVDPASITLDGAPLTAASYAVAANVFLTGGGDGFRAFTNSPDVITGPLDIDALTGYLAVNSPVSPPALDRAVSLDPARSFDDDGSGTGPCDLPVAPPVGTPGGPGGSDTPGTPGTPGAPGTPVVNPVAGGPGNGIGAGRLADTGVATGQMLGLAALLLASGGAAIVVGHRRRGLTD